jgi:hypothetical protein
MDSLFEPEMKQHFMEWHHMTMSHTKFKTVPLAGYMMENVFWNMNEVVFVKIREKGTALNLETQVMNLQRLH